MVTGLKKTLERIMYKDRCDVSRAQFTKIGKTDDTSRSYYTVYSQIPCKLAQYGKELSAHRDDVSQKITEDLRLTYDPVYDIHENDVLDIVHRGQNFKLFAGTPFYYATHVELSVRRRKEAGHK